MIGGRQPSDRVLRIRGLVTVAVIGVIIGLVAWNPFSGNDDQVRFSIVAPTLPDGIRDGVPVDVRGETVGSVCDLDISHREVTRVVVCVRDSALSELTDGAEVSYVSRNLFGSDALRITPTGIGSRVFAGSTVTLSQPPADYTITATVRSAGGFTLPVLTPRLSELLGRVSDTTIRLAPFLTAATVTLQTMDRGRVTDLTGMLPTLADAFDGLSAAGTGAVGGLQTLIGNRLLDDAGYVHKVQTMIGDIGSLFSNLGALFNGMSGLGATMDLLTAFTTPMTVALRDVTPAQVGAVLKNLGGAFHRDPHTGRTVLSIQAGLDVVPGASTPLSLLLTGKGHRP